jgi:hypothetical protein
MCIRASSIIKRCPIVVAGFLMLPVLAFAQAPSETTLNGTWSITFYLESNHVRGATQCVVFKTTSTEPSGEERRGTWTSPSFHGWRGEWQQDGDHVQWYGFTAGAAIATSEFGHLPSKSLASGEFNHFLAPDGTTSSAGGWIAKRVKECDETESTRAQGNVDPAAK